MKKLKKKKSVVPVTIKHKKFSEKLKKHISPDAWPYTPRIVKLSGIIEGKAEKDFTQEIINEIVLWKVNRYAKCDLALIKNINKISARKNNAKFDKELTRFLIKEMLKVEGIRLPMASTILRFRNPYLYQIVDFRMCNVLELNEEYKEALRNKNHDEVISFYFVYLGKLRKLSRQHKIAFCDADKILWALDKNENKNRRDK